MLEKAIFHPTYFPSIVQYALMVKHKDIVFEVNGNFQKQTYRNRCYILGANGKQLLNVPISKKSGKQKTKDIIINYSENWQKEHLKSLISAYKSSPFFEFYIDDFMPIFTKKEKYLINLNTTIFSLLNEAIQVNIPYELSKEYITDSENNFRYLVNAKKEALVQMPKYTQVFSNKYGFIPNLSMLDLLFNEGPNAEMYLNSLKF